MSFRGASESPINLLTLHVLGLWEEAGEQKKKNMEKHASFTQDGNYTEDFYF